MNFKESYKKDYEDIKTDEMFRKRLSAEMNAASDGRKIRIGFYAAAAAVILFVLGLNFLIFMPAEEQSGIIQEQVGTVSTVSAEGLFTQEKWYAGAETDEEIWDKFRELIGSGDITSLYCGSTEQLGEADILSGTAEEELCRKLSLAVPCEDKELSGEISFCMAVFGDGKIIKFRISDSGQVQLGNAEIICKYE
ncbi:MAG: hypothetical protein K2H90_03730 [Oscillospiraceae bacterium]|nr:hypothetical protein [Oscillospiraceae bacterium]